MRYNCSCGTIVCSRKKYINGTRAAIAFIVHPHHQVFSDGMSYSSTHVCFVHVSFVLGTMHVPLSGSFKDTLYYSFKNLFFSIFQPSLSGSEWLMILRWIVERSSGGSARPWGGPGPPIAGFVMVCPWHLRYPSYPEIPFLSSLIALSSRIFQIWIELTWTLSLTWNI